MLRAGMASSRAASILRRAEGSHRETGAALRELRKELVRADAANRQQAMIAQRQHVPPLPRARPPVVTLPWRFLGRNALPNKLDSAWWGVQKCPYERCPRCRKVFEKNRTKRWIHYCEAHYDALFMMGRHPQLTHAQRWLAQNVGPDCDERRYCLQGCTEHFDSRVHLLRHLRKRHARIYHSLKGKYLRRARIAGRPIDRSVHRYFNAH